MESRGSERRVAFGKAELCFGLDGRFAAKLKEKGECLRRAVIAGSR